MQRQKERRVVVTGYGSLSSLGNSANEIWDAITNYNVGYKHISHEDENIVAKYFGIIDTSLPLKRIPKSIRKFTPKFAKLGLLAAQEALNMAFESDASLDDAYDPFQRGVIFGTGWGGQDDTVNCSNLYNEERMASPFANIMGMHSVGTAAISLRWNLRGYQNTPVAACATGNIAIGDAYEIIRSGRAEMMLAGGGESIRDLFNVWSVDILGALSKEQTDVRKACAPFSLNRSGFVMSEGAAVLCIENYESAIQRGATLFAEIVGYGNYSDAYDITAPAEDIQARSLSIREACRSNRISPSDIDYVNAHGTSTPANDVNETNSLKDALGGFAYNIPISSTKSYTGHLVAGAGSLESIFCIKSIETGMIPATIHLDNPDPECDLNYVPNTHLFDQKVDVALNVNYGFGGANSALIFQRCV